MGGGGNPDKKERPLETWKSGAWVSEPPQTVHKVLAEAAGGSRFSLSYDTPVSQPVEAVDNCIKLNSLNKIGWRIHESSVTADGVKQVCILVLYKIKKQLS